MRKTTGVIAVLVMAVFCAAATYAENVTVPNTFSSGATAKASEVNADFAALVNALPGVKVVDAEGDLTGVSTSWVNLGSITISAPRAGYVIVKSNGYLPLNSGGFTMVGVSDNSAAIGTGSHCIEMYTTEMNMVLPYCVEYVFTVSAAGTATYYLVCRSTVAYTSGNISGVLIAEFIPNKY